MISYFLQIANEFKVAFQRMGMDPDYFIRTSDESHELQVPRIPIPSPLLSNVGGAGGDNGSWVPRF